MAERTFGWVQEAYTPARLKNVVRVFLPGSAVNRQLREDRIPRLIEEEYGRDAMLAALAAPEQGIAYGLLKGKGIPAGCTRSSAPCSGIVQAALPGQRKEYQSDWPADSYLRWAVSIGLLDYDRNADTCALSAVGREYALTEDGSAQEDAVFTRLLLSYPPVCRILQLLNREGTLTKFEMGAQLGFVGEAGFTSVPQHMILQGLAQTADPEERNRLLANAEGTSDKYVRTLCSWLIKMGWVQQLPKTVTEQVGGRVYTGEIPQAYQLTLKGRTASKGATGASRQKREDKRVLWDMLATKVPDRDYIRNRRTVELKALAGHARTLPQLAALLAGQSFKVQEDTIRDDLRGFAGIGLNLVEKRDGWTVQDTLTGLEIPQAAWTLRTAQSDLTDLKERVRHRLAQLDHRYLILIDLGFDGKADRDFEIQTAELFTAELGFGGGRLGDTRKPDGAFYAGSVGLILDNKAYGKGYSLPITQADEMQRYLEENHRRDRSLNANEWWKIFPPQVERFYFGFVSGRFAGGFENRLQNITARTGVPGGAISAVSLLLWAEEVKAGRLGREAALEAFGVGRELSFLPEDFFGGAPCPGAEAP